MKYGHHNENVSPDMAQYFTKILHKLRCWAACENVKQSNGN